MRASHKHGLGGGLLSLTGQIVPLVTPTPRARYQITTYVGAREFLSWWCGEGAIEEARRLCPVGGRATVSDASGVVYRCRRGSDGRVRRVTK